MWIKNESVEYAFNSCKDAGKKGKFNIRVYFDCEQSDIDISVIDDPKIKFEEVEEEEEDVAEARPELKELLKIRGRAILY